MSVASLSAHSLPRNMREYSHRAQFKFEIGMGLNEYVLYLMLDECVLTLLGWRTQNRLVMWPVMIVHARFSFPCA